MSEACLVTSDVCLVMTEACLVVLHFVLCSTFLPFVPVFTLFRQIKKIQTTKSIYSRSGRTLTTQSTGPQPIQLVPKHCFYRYLSIGRSNKKNKKTRSIFFKFCFWEEPPQSPPSQLVPNPFNWSPNTVFNRYLSNGRSNQKIQQA